MKIKAALTIYFFLVSFVASAADFGLLFNQYAGIENDENNELVVKYRGNIVPRLSILFGEDNKFGEISDSMYGSFIVSAGFKMDYTVTEEANSFYFIPELLRTELMFNIKQFQIKAGRINYSDPLNFIASGLFDGAHFTYKSPLGKISLGAFYTGLIYKETLEISMTPADIGKNLIPFNYDDFSYTYFAPKRFFGALDWEFPSIGGVARIKTAIIGQFDLNGYDEKLNSQYLIIKSDIVINKFLIELGGSASYLQRSSSFFFIEDEDYFALAGILGVSLFLPGNYYSRLSFNAKYSSGKINDALGAFIPITTHYFGEIIQVRMTNMSIFNLNYSSRFTETFSMSAGASYFVRIDLFTANNYPVTETGSDGYFLGSEFYTKLNWSPFSDMKLIFGAAIFLPSLGNVYKDEELRWRVDLAFNLALF